MKTRSAFKIPVSVIFLYNAGLVALSLYMFIEVIPGASDTKQMPDLGHGYFS